MSAFAIRLAVVAAAIGVLVAAHPAAAVVFTVTNNLDAGAGSLRNAMTAANATPAFDEIRFNLPAGQRVITPATSLPVMTTPVDINGTSQPGYAGVPLVTLKGTTAGGTGLRLVGNLSSVRGLAIHAFATGVRMEGALFVVEANYIGLDSTGAGGAGNTGTGIAVDGSFGTVGGSTAADRNVISGNGGNGMTIGANATSNDILGNYFGTNPAGTAAIGNGSYAIRSFGAGNSIGSNAAGGGNLISGNARGISLESENPEGTSIRGNIIGLNAAGTAAIPNSYHGIEVYSDGNFIGGTFAGDRNVISGNTHSGIVVREGQVNNLIEANYIGTDPTGTIAFGNGGVGIVVHGDSNTIGGTVAGAANLVSGNNGGIDVNGINNVVQGNRVGTNATGTEALLEEGGGTGIRIYGHDNTVGGNVAAARNLISGNGAGLATSGDGNTVQGNYIGTDVTGMVAIGNAGIGISVDGESNLIGGAAAGESNLVSGNGGGIDVSGTMHVVQGNLVGTNAAGTAALGGVGGIRIYGSDNTIGGTEAGARNVISGGGGMAIIGGEGNTIQGNYVGTNISGNAAIPNGGYALRLISATGNFIGGTAPGAGNVFSGNNRGVTLDADAPGNVFEGNIIGLAADGQTPMGNDDSGLEIYSADNVIGGTDPGAGNIIASNQYYGIVFGGPGATNNLVQGNRIGVAADGTTLRGNWFNIVYYGASGNIVGGIEPGAGNIIAGAVNSGAFVWFGTHNQMRGNSIFSNGGLGLDLDPTNLSADDSRDGDTGANERQNMPALTSVLVVGADIDIAGKLSSRPATTYDIDFYSSPACDPSGFGEGQTYLGSSTVMTDEDGIGLIEATVPFSSADTVVTATATSPEGDTSEFSPCAVIDAGEDAGVLQFSQMKFLGYEEQGFVTVLVSRSGGATGTVSVQYATMADTATAPADYTDVSGTLTFADGEFLKSFDVPLVLDGPDGADQTIDLLLTNPTGGATLGAQATSEILLFDYSTDFPGVYISSASISEGDNGTKNLEIEVSVTPTDHTVTFNVRTTAGTATAGLDYEDIDVAMSFAAGEAPKTVSVPILGDAADEGIEVFFLMVSGQLLPGGYAGNIGHGFILDDDGDPECGNLAVQAPETCDDGDLLYTAGDYCSADCIAYQCGIPTRLNATVPKAGDALFVLKAAVQSSNCDLRVCDVNESGTVTATDSLVILRRAVGQPVPLQCPA
ncbi:MAG TPA: Calx-beta domain-containing protein [Candidatus Limnocylindrales bacterium]|nr:Calx-beta domain-containing protein [Candidatus Limnocylindrales bacterium]